MTETTTVPGTGANRAAAAATIDVENPSTGKVIASVPVVPPEQIAELVERARRAQPGWAPRELPHQVQDSLWGAVRSRAPFAFRSVGVGVVLHRSDAKRSTVVASKGEPVATVTGEPLELLLYVFGRRDHAAVEVTGDAAAVSALAAASLEV